MAAKSIYNINIASHYINQQLLGMSILDNQNNLHKSVGMAILVVEIKLMVL